MTGFLPQPDRPCGDALVFAEWAGRRWVLLVEREQGGWAIPGGKPEPGDGDPLATAVRELAEETGLKVWPRRWHICKRRWVPDTRFEASGVWSVLCVADLGPQYDLPLVAAMDGVRHAAWVRAETFDVLVNDLADRFGGAVYGPHMDMLADAVDGQR
jgi:8-oxo-dGTP pyrophosphatase MutT (NUDIX family)